MGEHEVSGLRPAIFLDRDGVINRAVVRAGKPYPPASMEEFVLLDGVEEALRLLKLAGFLLVVVTNQPDVGRGSQSMKTVEDIHGAMRAALPIDRVEVCCDADDNGASGRRKPKPGMLLDAARELHIDLCGSFMIGDRWRDVDCGHAAGCITVFIDYGYDEQLRSQPDFTVASLLEAARWIVARADTAGGDTEKLRTNHEAICQTV